MSFPPSFSPIPSPAVEMVPSDDSSFIPTLANTLVLATAVGAAAYCCLRQHPPIAPRPAIDPAWNDFYAHIRPALTAVGIGTTREELAVQGANLAVRAAVEVGTEGYRAASYVYTNVSDRVKHWWAIRQATPIIQGHLATVQANLRAATDARNSAQRFQLRAADAANTPITATRSDRDNANAVQILANSANGQAVIAETAATAAETAATAVTNLLRQNPGLARDPAIAANVALINRDSPLARQDATAARAAATAAAATLATVNGIANVIDTLNGHLASARANVQTANQARDAAQVHLTATRAALENARLPHDEHLATGNTAADASAEQATKAETAAAQARAFDTIARGLAHTQSQTSVRASINVAALAAEEAAVAAREHADIAKTLATDTSRRIQAEAALAEARQALNFDIFLFLEDLQAVTPHSYDTFIARMIRDYPLITPEEIRATLQRAISEKKGSIEALVAYLRSDEASAGILAVNQRQIATSIERARALRGIWGFDGLINIEWSTYFAAAKQEILIVVSVYKSLIPDENPVLSEDERAAILNILPQSEGSAARLMAIATAYKNRLPAGLRAMSFNALITTRAPEALRGHYDQTNRAKEAAFLRHGNLNTEYEIIGGSGFNPDIDVEERGALRLYRVAKDTVIDQRQRAITEPLAEIEQKVAFWERILAELAPAADAGAAAV